MSAANPYVLLDVKFTLNAADMSAWVTKVTLTESAASLDTSAFGSSGWGSSIAGMKKFSITLDFLQDFTATTGLDAVLSPLVFTNQPFTVQSTSASVSTSNPKYSGTVAILGYTPFDGGIGDLSKTSVTWDGIGALTRVTT